MANDSSSVNHFRTLLASIQAKEKEQDSDHIYIPEQMRKLIFDDYRAMKEKHPDFEYRNSIKKWIEDRLQTNQPSYYEDYKRTLMKRTYNHFAKKCVNRHSTK